jgi:hypothetical protein
MFNLAIDSKLRGSNLAHERPLCARSGHSPQVGFWTYSVTKIPKGTDLYGLDQGRVRRIEGSLNAATSTCSIGDT